MLEKQPGTVAPPIRVTVSGAGKQAQFWTSLRTDIRVRLRMDHDGLVVDGPTDDTVQAQFARHAALVQGLDQWAIGQHDAAIRTWQTAGALDLAVDHVRTLVDRGATAEALDRLRAIDAVTSNGHAAFEAATILEQQGDGSAADPLYRRAAELSPDNPLAQLTWGRRLSITGSAVPPLDHLATSSAAVRRWRRELDQIEPAGEFFDTLAYLQVLQKVLPNDRGIEMRYAAFLEREGQWEAAVLRYDAVAKADPDDILGQLARAHLAVLHEAGAEAIALYRAALPAATSFWDTLNIADGLRQLGDISGALLAYEQAAELEPYNPRPLLSAGDALRHSDPTAARSWYERALAAGDPGGEAHYALGTLLIDGGDLAGAVPLLEAAVAAQPDQQRFSDALEQARAQTLAGPSSTP